MNLISVLTIIQYAVAPYLWLIIAAVVILVAAQLAARLTGYRFTHHHSLIAVALAIVTGLSSLVWIPWLTHSRLAYVATVFDWVVMIAAVVAVAVAALLVLHPISFLMRRR